MIAKIKNNVRRFQLFKDGSSLNVMQETKKLHHPAILEKIRSVNSAAF